MELPDFPLDTIMLRAVRGMPAAQPAKSRFDIEIEQDRDVRPGPVSRETVQADHRINVQPSAVALVGRGRVKEAIADHNCPAFQCRHYYCPRQLGPARGKQERLGLRHEMLTPWVVLEKVPYGFADARAARFPDRQDIVAVSFQISRQAFGLRSLSTSLDTLKRDEQSSQNLPCPFLFRG